MMDEHEVFKLLAQVGAILTDGHFVYTSGKHGSAYVDKDAIWPRTTVASQLGRAMAQRFSDDRIDVVLAPAIGGIPFGQWTAFHLSALTGREVLAVYAEPGTIIGRKSFELRRGFDRLVRNQQVLVVEDVLTTGHSARMVVDAARREDGIVVGVGVVCNRGGVTAADLDDVPHLAALVNLSLEAWDPDACLLCQESVPINLEVGHGRKFLDRQAAIRRHFLLETHKEETR